MQIMEWVIRAEKEKSLSKRVGNDPLIVTPIEVEVSPDSTMLW